MAGGSRSRGNRSANGAGTSRSAAYQPLNDGARRSTWKLPETDEEWRNYGRTAADYPFTAEEEQDWEMACENYYFDNDGKNPPTYHCTQPTGLPQSQRITPLVQKSIDEANAGIERVKGMWNHNRGIQQGKMEYLAEKKRELAMTRAHVRELQRQIKEVEEELQEIEDDYTGMEDVIKEKVNFITGIQDAFQS